MGSDPQIVHPSVKGGTTDSEQTGRLCAVSLAALQGGENLALVFVPGGARRLIVVLKGFTRWVQQLGWKMVQVLTIC